MKLRFVSVYNKGQFGVGLVTQHHPVCSAEDAFIPTKSLSGAVSLRDRLNTLLEEEHESTEKSAAESSATQQTV